MKNFFILLMVVLMLAGLTFGSFAQRNCPNDNGDCLQVQDGSCQDCPGPGECDPIGDGPQYRWGKQS